MLWKCHNEPPPKEVIYAKIVKNEEIQPLKSYYNKLSKDNIIKSKRM
jgi:hypothetical protein